MIDKFEGEYRFLSNFYDSPITWWEWECPTVEHAFQASKTHDKALAQAIATTGTPGMAKRAGRNAPLRDDWEGIKLDVMRGCLAAKFAQHSELGDRLLATGDHMLIEGNTWNDRYWGVCRNVGANWLGHLLMARRAELRSLI